MKSLVYKRQWSRRRTAVRFMAGGFSISKGMAVYRILALMVSFTLCLMHMKDYSSVCQASSYSFIILSKYHTTLKIGQTTRIIGVAANGKTVRWKSSKSSVASVDTYGKITAKKAGTCVVTAKVSGAEAGCKVTVKKTEIRLNATSVTMENGGSFRLKADTSNGSQVTWSSSKSSVASVEEDGSICAKKVGEARITAKADGTKKTCKVTVKKPKITLSKTALVMAPGEVQRLTARVSSHRTPVWKSKKPSVASVDDSGNISALKPGVTVISCTVDGTKKECCVTVKEQ